MAVIYLKHERHGFKVACSEMEAEHDRGVGWVDFDPNAPVEQALPDFLTPPNSPKRGRPKSV